LTDAELFPTTGIFGVDSATSFGGSGACSKNATGRCATRPMWPDYAEEPRVLNTSLDHFNVRPVAWRVGERPVAGDDRRIERLCQGYVHGVVRRDVLAQFPGARQEIDVRMAMEIEIREVRDRVGRSVG